MSAAELAPHASRDGSVVVLSTRAFTAEHLEVLRSVSPALELRQHSAESGDEVADLLTPDVEVLYTSFPPAKLPGGSRLRWVQFHKAGIDHVPGTPLWDAEVALTTASGVHAVTIAEYTVGLMLAMARRLPEVVDLQRRREMPPPGMAQPMLLGRELRGATAVIVGYGAIGREVARLCQSFGMSVRAVRRSAGPSAHRGYSPPGTGDPDGRIPDEWYPITDLVTAVDGADYVVVATPLTAETDGIVGRDVLAAMGGEAVLVNVARGRVVDELALVEALGRGQIRGAALDAFAVEPLPARHRLWDAPNVIISPHVSGGTPRYLDYAADLFSSNLSRYLAGQPLLNIVDRQRGY